MRCASRNLKQEHQRQEGLSPECKAASFGEGDYFDCDCSDCSGGKTKSTPTS